jgi:hypothetical protein
MPTSPLAHALLIGEGASNESVKLPKNSRKTERGAKQFLARFEVRDAPFALPCHWELVRVQTRFNN